MVRQFEWARRHSCPPCLPTPAPCLVSYPAPCGGNQLPAKSSVSAHGKNLGRQEVVSPFRGPGDHKVIGGRAGRVREIDRSNAGPVWCNRVFAVCLAQVDNGSRTAWVLRFSTWQVHFDPRGQSAVSIEGDRAETGNTTNAIGIGIPPLETGVCESLIPIGHHRLSSADTQYEQSSRQHIPR